MVAEWAKTIGDTISPVNLLQKLNAEMYTYDPNKYQVKTTPFTKPKTGLAELVSNKPPINILTVKDLVTEAEPSKVENRIIIPKVVAEDKPTKVKKASKQSSKKDPSSNISIVGEGVGALQRQMNEAGANLVVDNKWGPKTQAAWEAYQAKMATPAIQGTTSADIAKSSYGTNLTDWQGVPVENGLASSVGFWERLFKDDRTPEQKAAEQQAVVDKILGGASGNTGLAAAQYGR